MLVYIGRRAASMFVVLFAASIVVFLFLHLAPGDPAQILLAGRPTTEEALAAVRAKYALDQPLPVQYISWIGNVLQGDLGESIKGRDEVIDVLRPRLTTTLALTAYAALLMLVIGIPLGIVSAVRRSGVVDVTASLGALIAASIPPYVSGVVLIAIFAVALGWFPALGSGSGGTDTFYHLTLPAIALALSAIAMVSRVTRISMIDALATEYVETARIRGFSSRRVILKHAFRSALIPVVTVSGVVVGYLLSGAILVEYTFGLNGIGSLLVSSVQGLDYAVVQAIALIITAEFLLISLVVDILYAVIDPRVRLTGAGRS
jgi:peptide/nickel transport system permease protein